MLTTRNCHFNPRSLTGATFDIHVFSTQISISIHAPSRERRCCSISIGIPHIFQSTLPRGSDYLTATELLSIVEFQSTLPRGSDFLFCRSHTALKNFNPRSLAGATSVRYNYILTVSEISIHAPSRERLKIFEPWNDVITFQSTLPRGSDPADTIRADMGRISIHAPSRERLRVRHILSFDSNFNPRSLAGATAAQSPLTQAAIFQSTLPRGSDILYCSSTNRLSKFQSTLPRGSDYKIHIKTKDSKISIHAPSRERLLLSAEYLINQ